MANQPTSQVHEKQWSDPFILKSIPNPASLAYRIRIENPEVTFLGMQKQPDFGTFVIEYVPNKRVIELKSLKEYFFQFRQSLISYERLVTTVYGDLLNAYLPKWLKVTATFNPRGGMASTITVDSEVINQKRAK